MSNNENYLNLMNLQERIFFLEKALNSLTDDIDKAQLTISLAQAKEELRLLQSTPQQL
jgi:hypothetical protein